MWRKTARNWEKILVLQDFNVLNKMNLGNSETPLFASMIAPRNHFCSLPTSQAYDNSRQLFWRDVIMVVWSGITKHTETWTCHHWRRTLSVFALFSNNQLFQSPILLSTTFLYFKSLPNERLFWVRVTNKVRKEGEKFFFTNTTGPAVCRPHSLSRMRVHLIKTSCREICTSLSRAAAWFTRLLQGLF